MSSAATFDSVDVTMSVTDPSVSSSPAAAAEPGEPDSHPSFDSSSSYLAPEAPRVPYTGPREVWMTANQARTESRKLKGFRWIPVSGSAPSSTFASSLIPPMTEKRQRKIKDLSEPGENDPFTAPPPATLNRQQSARKSMPGQSGKRKAETASEKELFEIIRQKERKIADMEERLKMLKEQAAGRKNEAESADKRKKSPLIRSQTPKSRPKVPAFEDVPMSSGSATPSASRTGRVIRTPQQYSGTGEQVFLPPVLKKLGTLLTAMVHNKRQQGVFNEPVNHSDPSKPLYAVNYLETIKGPPMDFATIRSRLNSGEYNEPAEFARDVRLVFRNATVYNPPDSWIYQAAQAMQTQFEEDFNRIVNQTTEKKVKAEAPQPYASAIPRADFSAGEAAPVAQSPPRRPAPAMQRQQSGPARGRFSEPLTQKEKQQLKDDIFKLPSTALGPVVEIISKAMPQSMQSDEDEMEIDIDKLDIPTLRELQDYIRKSLNALRKQATNAGPRASTTGAIEATHPSPQAESAAPSAAAAASNPYSDSDSDAEYPGSGRPSHQSQAQGSAAPSHSTAPAIIEFGAEQSNQNEEDVEIQAGNWELGGTAQAQAAANDSKADDAIWKEFQSRSEEERMREQQKDSLLAKQESELARQSAELREKAELRKKELEALEEAKRAEEERRAEEARLALEAERERARKQRESEENRVVDTAEQQAMEQLERFNRR